jgi:outer membrane receptor for ferrienterochelin and colicins
MKSICNNRIYRMIICIVLATILHCINVHAQTLIIYVFDIDNGQKPLQNASAYWIGSSKGMISDKDGMISLKKKENDSLLIVSLIGYKKDTVLITKDSDTIQVLLKQDIVLENIIVEDKSLSTITKAEIRTERISSAKLRESACCSLAESFERSPSVEVSYSDAATGSKYIQLLGLRGMYTQQLQEAVPGFRGLALPFAMDYVPGAFLESISISKGAASVLNGYEGIAGQINIEYIKPFNSPSLFVNAYINQMQRYEVNIASASEIAKGWDFLLMTHGRIFNHEIDGNQDGYIDMPLFKQGNIACKIEHSTANTEFQFFVKGLLDNYKGGMTGQHSHAVHNSDTLFMSETSTQRGEFFSKLGFMELDYSFAKSIAFQISGSVHSMLSTIGQKKYNGDEQSFIVKGIAVQDFEDHTLRYGISFLYDNYTEQFMNSDRLRTEYVPGIFAENTFSPNSSFSLVTGLRADYHNLYGMIVTPRIHAKYSIDEQLQLRVSAGSGMRVSNPITDNLSAFVSNRIVVIDSILNPEKAWNYGGSVTYTTSFFTMPITLDAEVYRTQFSNQVITDFDRSSRIIAVANDSMSYAQSAMLQIECTPWQYSSISLAWRYNDVWLTTNGKQQRKAMLSPHRVLSTFSQNLFDNAFQVDFTAVWNSSGRISSTKDNPEYLRFSDSYPDFSRFSIQCTWRSPTIDVYAGIENITNTLQSEVVIDGMNPQSEYFDASLVWGPLDNRTIYCGIRMQIP